MDDSLTASRNKRRVWWWWADNRQGKQAMAMAVLLEVAGGFLFFWSLSWVSFGAVSVRARPEKKGKRKKK